MFHLWSPAALRWPSPPAPQTPLTSAESFTTTSRVPKRLDLTGGTDSMSVPPIPPPGGKGRVTSQILQGGGQVTMGTQLPQKPLLYLPPIPLLNGNWVICLPHPVDFLTGDCSRGHQLHEPPIHPAQAAKAARGCCAFPRPSKSRRSKGLGYRNLHPQGLR